MTPNISQNSRRVAKNTLLLYVRMLLMMFIGLFTSRVVLQSLGVEDFGTYTLIYEMVMIFNIVSASVSNAISRFMAYELGGGNTERQRKVFGSAVTIQCGLAILLTLLSATLGLWYLHNGMSLPQGRESDAELVMALITCTVAVQLFSIPFNAAIIANEDMKAFAWISIVEALLKLGVAAALYTTTADRLIMYSVLMLGVTAAIRLIYLIYCRRHYEMTRGRFCAEWSTIRSMLSFSAWSFLGNSAVVLNTKGMSLLANSFFGVGVNAARGVAMQVENIVKQFVSNFLTALNPQITKSWAAGSVDYCFELVGKGSKFSILIMSFFVVPFAFESDMLLHIWLGNVPDYAAVFTSLTLIYLLVDMGLNSVFQMVLSTGRIGWYYTVTSLISSSAFVLTYAAFRMGMAPQYSYIILIGVGLVVDGVKLLIARRITGLKLWAFLREHLMGACAVILLDSAVCALIYFHLPQTTARLLLILCASTACIAAMSYAFVLTRGEKDYIRDILHKLTSFSWKRKS